VLPYLRTPLPGVRRLDHALGVVGGLVLLAWPVRW
jgi:hypothetical protein